jgi:hypothetical protein
MAEEGEPCVKHLEIDQFMRNQIWNLHVLSASLSEEHVIKGRWDDNFAHLYTGLVSGSLVHQGWLGVTVESQLVVGCCLDLVRKSICRVFLPPLVLNVVSFYHLGLKIFQWDSC